MTPNLGLTTVLATLAHGALFLVALARFAHHTDAAVDAKATAASIHEISSVASGIEMDPASGANRNPVVAAADAPSADSDKLIAVDVTAASNVSPQAASTAGSRPSQAASTVGSGPSGSDPGASSGTLSGPPVSVQGARAAESQPSASRPTSANQARKAQDRGGGGRGGMQSRHARHAKREDSIKAMPMFVEIDMGQPGGVDALLYGPGSPGLPHDLSSPPRIGGYVYWECPWPAAAARAGADHAVVHVTVDVTAKGEPKAAQLIDQPGYEFGEDAIRCAMDQRYIPGRDSNGVPVAGRTRKFSVQFNRHGAGGVP